MEMSASNIPSPEMDAQAELEQLRAQQLRERETDRLTAAFYIDVLSKVESQEEMLDAAIVMLRDYLIGMEMADPDQVAWAYMFENPYGLRTGWSTEGADGEAAALAREAFESAPGAQVIAVPEHNTFLVVPLPDVHSNHTPVGVIAIPALPGIALDERLSTVALTISTSVAMHMDRVLRIVEASRRGQYAQAAARAQLHLNEPAERADALKIAIDALSDCDDLVGGIAFEVIEGSPSVVTSFGLIDEKIAAAMVDGQASEDEDECKGYISLPIILEDRTEAALVVTSKTSIEAVEDEMLGSIAAAVTGSVARSRATGTIESLRRSATRRLVEAQERERSMVAADIHDGVLQQLGATAIRLELAQARVEQRDFDTASTIIEEGAKEIRSCARELRALLMELRPQVLDDNGLNAALSELGRHVDGVEIEVKSDVPDDLGSEFSITIFRIVQEALTNIQKHARAEHATVEVMLDGDSIQIAIRDDGIGYEGAVTGPSSEGSHLGLLGMRERARMLGGRFSISGGSGSGTLIEANLPLSGLTGEDSLI
jgi:signal transduction histidine kinase